MPNITYTLADKETLDTADFDKLKAAKGKTWKVTLTDAQVEKGKLAKDYKITDLIAAELSGLKLSKSGQQLVHGKAKLTNPPTAPGTHNLDLKVNKTVLNFKVELTPPAVKKAVVAEPAEIEYSNATVKQGCSGKEFQTKIKSIAAAGKSEKGHGPVEYLGNALHAHVTNSESVAWKWNGDKMLIVAFGKKNDKNSTQQRGGKGRHLKTCDYDWTD